MHVATLISIPNIISKPSTINSTLKEATELIDLINTTTLF